MTLDAIPLFRHLSPSELAALRQIAQERKFPAGERNYPGGRPG